MLTYVDIPLVSQSLLRLPWQTASCASPLVLWRTSHRDLTHLTLSAVFSMASKCPHLTLKRNFPALFPPVTFRYSSESTYSCSTCETHWFFYWPSCPRLSRMLHGWLLPRSLVKHLVASLSVAKHVPPTLACSMKCFSEPAMYNN